MDEAIATLQKVRELLGDRIPPEYVGLVGYAYGKAGRRADALSLLRDLNERAKKEYVPSIAVAHIYMGLGQTEQALEWLEKAYEEHELSLVWLNVLPRYDPLRSDPRFKDLLRRIGFPDP